MPWRIVPLVVTLLVSALTVLVVQGKAGPQVATVAPPPPADAAGQLPGRPGQAGGHHLVGATGG